MYARRAGGRTLSFGVSGMLFRDNLVMYDRQTDTLWTQADGRAIKGSLTGTVLSPLPSVLATWEEWKALYPDSRVLKKGGEFRSPYERYNRTGQMGILGRRLTDDRLKGKERILGIRHDGAAVAFPVAAVREARLVQAEVGRLPVLLAAADPELPVVAFDREHDGRVLTFELVDNDPRAVRDQETGSTWRLADGIATAGPLEGSQLKRVVAHPAFWFGWRGFFPHSDVWEPEA